jgi:hypothetical protein
MSVIRAGRAAFTAVPCRRPACKVGRAARPLDRRGRPLPKGVALCIVAPQFSVTPN